MALGPPGGIRQNSIEVFCCYASEDREMFLELRKHIRPLERDRLITVESDLDIHAGVNWEEELQHRFITAQIILLLISPDFLASDDCYYQMEQAVEQRRRRNAKVIRVMLRPVDWQGELLDTLQVLPTNRKPVTDSAWHNKDQAFSYVARGIRQEAKACQDEKERARLAAEFRQKLELLSALGLAVISVLLQAGTSANRCRVQILAVISRYAISLVSWGRVINLLKVLLIFFFLFSILDSPSTTILLKPTDLITPTFSPSPSTTTLLKPTDLITPGVLTVGIDIGYAPMEYEDSTTGQFKGFDIDLGTALAKKMGLKPRFEIANFATIIDALNAHRYDIVIADQMVTHEREKLVAFVPYFRSGLSLLVQKGNPQNIQSMTDLCGQSVGVEDGTVELDLLKDTNKKCELAGKPIKIIDRSTQTDVFGLLVKHSVVAIFQDAPVTEYYQENNPDLFEIAGYIIDTNIEGISIRKGDASLFTTVQQALNMILVDRTYYALLANWQLGSSLAI